MLHSTLHKKLSDLAKIVPALYFQVAAALVAAVSSEADPQYFK